MILSRDGDVPPTMTGPLHRRGLGVRTRGSIVPIRFSARIPHQLRPCAHRERLTARQQRVTLLSAGTSTRTHIDALYST